MRKVKVRWKNVVKLILFICCISIIIHDLFMISIYNWLTDNSYGLTWFGFITFILLSSIASMIYDDLEEQTKSIQCYQPKHAKDTTVRK